jgi:hypothetical protein
MRVGIKVLDAYFTYTALQVFIVFSVNFGFETV